MQLLQLSNLPIFHRDVMYDVRKNHIIIYASTVYEDIAQTKLVDFVDFGQNVHN